MNKITKPISFKNVHTKIKGVYTKYVVENYLNFILTVIAILLYSNVIVINDRLRGIDYELDSINSTLEYGLSNIETSLDYMGR